MVGQRSASGVGVEGEMSVQLEIPQEVLYDGHGDLLGVRLPTDLMEGSRYDLLYAVLGSFLLWTDFYFILHAFNNLRSAEWNCRIVTAIHGVLVTSLCLLSACVFGPWPFSYIGKANTNLHTTILIISLGYFLFDFLWCVYMRTEGPVMLAHHVVSIVGMSYCLYQGKFGSEITAVTGASEVTNPLLQLRWFTREIGMYKGTLAILLDWAFITVFWGARLIVGSAFHIVCQTSPDLDLITKAGGQAFYIISWVFGVQLLRFIYRKYIRKKPGKLD